MTRDHIGNGSRRAPWRRLAVAVAATVAAAGLTAGAVDAQIIHPIEPFPVIAAAPSSGVAPLTVTFDGSGSFVPATRTLTAWTWNFGDGTTGTGAITTHVYSAPGSYSASLVVTTDLGLTSVPAFVAITVTAPPLPTVPAAPADLSAAAGRRSVALTWVNGAVEQTSVSVERCKGAGCSRFEVVATLAGTAASFADGRVSSRTSYSYRVRARNGVGWSAYSNVATVQTPR